MNDLPSSAERDTATFGARTRPLLSILIPTLANRRESFQRIYDQLQSQIEATNWPVEIVSLLDNRVRSVGAKRNCLLLLASGRYIAFVDDDDRVADNYIDTICQVLNASPTLDVLGFDVLAQRGGRTVRYRLGAIREGELPYERDGRQTFNLQWTHLCAWRRELALGHLFPDRNTGEDCAWAELVAREIRYAKRVDEVLYYYDYSYLTSETRGKNMNTGAAAVYSSISDLDHPQKEACHRFAHERRSWWAGALDGGRLIDVGAGRAEVLKAALDVGHVGCRAVTIDLGRFHDLGSDRVTHHEADLTTPAGRNLLRELGKGMNGSGDGSGTNGAAEAALCLNVLEHLPYPDVVRVIYSLAQAARRVVVTVATVGWEMMGRELRPMVIPPQQWHDLLIERFRIVEFQEMEGCCGFLLESRATDDDRQIGPAAHVTGQVEESASGDGEPAGE